MQFGHQHADGTVTRVEGCIFGDPQDTGEVASVSKLLAPLTPKAIPCIGLNY
ncbi:MAG TPA: 5-carboxymethyl-2-hydroxymuconate isomerase, partial [Planctomycetaceae bacterium]|nr:5-carboxymethyl-2-hydroxymuconate isomerase [Planctomycetaceae bacterium]